MSTFQVLVTRVGKVEKHPEADRLTVVQIKGFTCIANLKDDGSWRYNEGDLVVYVPADTVVPEATLKTIGFWDDVKEKGILAGSRGDRVKPLRLRGIFSEGILIPVVNMTVTDPNGVVHPVQEGMDVAEIFGLTKYEPTIPLSMSGEVFNAGESNVVPVKFDIEAYENYPDVLIEGELVTVTEKLHGTFTGFHFTEISHPETFNYITGKDKWVSAYVYSKGLGAQGLCFKNNEANVGNLYVRALNSISDEQIELIHTYVDQNGPIHIFGETYGRGVQDLHYGENTPVFRFFAVYEGVYPMGRYLNHEELERFSVTMGLQRVPLLGVMPYSYEGVIAHRDGKDSISNSNVREGVVVCPTEERRDTFLGRVQLKFVSPDYKLRKGKNLTENQ